MEEFKPHRRLKGLKVLASHHIEEGMQACADYLRVQNPWSSEHRTPEILEILDAYGAEGQRFIPLLRETAALIEKGEPDFPKALSKQIARSLTNAIEKIEAANNRPLLNSLHH